MPALIGDLVSDADEEVDVLVRSELLPGLLAKISDSKVVVRKAASQACAAYIAGTREPQSVAPTLVRLGFESADWKQRQATALFLSLSSTPLERLVRRRPLAPLAPSPRAKARSRRRRHPPPPPPPARRRRRRRRRRRVSYALPRPSPPQGGALREMVRAAVGLALGDSVEAVSTSAAQCLARLRAASADEFAGHVRARRRRCGRLTRRLSRAAPTRTRRRTRRSRSSTASCARRR